MDPEATRARTRVQIISTYYAPETTGNAPYATGLAEGLARDGYAVSVLAGAPHYPGWEILPESEWNEREVTDSGVRVRRLRAYVPARPTFVRRLRYELSHGVRFARHFDPDADVTVILSPSLFAAAVVQLRNATRLRKRPSVLWVQDLYHAGVKESSSRAGAALGRGVQLIERVVAGSSEVVVVIHERFRRSVTTALAIPDEKVVVVRNWCHVQPGGDADRESVRRRYGWTPTDVIALHAGNMGEKQGLENVIEAARLAEAKGSAVRFVLVGDGNQRRHLQELAGSCTNVIFVPPVPEGEFTDVLGAADVLIVNERPSLSEAAVPSKLTSYFSTGRPVVAATSQTSPTREEVRTSGAGVVVAAGDPTALLDAVEAIHNDWTEEDALAGPDFVQQHLTERAGIEAFERMIDRLVDARGQVQDRSYGKESSVA